MPPLPVEPVMHQPASAGRFLYVVAAKNECKPFLRGYTGSEIEVSEWQPTQIGSNTYVIVSGVGKANAAAATALALKADSYNLVISIGIGGLLPQNRVSVPSKLLTLGDVVLAQRSSFADEGVQSDEKFMPMHRIGFPLSSREGDDFVPQDSIIRRLDGVFDVMAPIATVSTCSGTDALAQQVADRTGCSVEGMEGAAVMLVADRLGVAGAEVRVISNTTGSRPLQRWDLRLAFETLERLAAQLRLIDEAN